MYKMYKDGEECMVEPDQRLLMEAEGWSTTEPVAAVDVEEASGDTEDDDGDDTEESINRRRSL